MDELFQLGMNIEEYGSGENCYVGIRAFPGQVLMCLSREKGGDIEVGLNTEDTRRLIDTLQSAVKCTDKRIE